MLHLCNTRLQDFVCTSHEIQLISKKYRKLLDYQLRSNIFNLLHINIRYYYKKLVPRIVLA